MMFSLALMAAIACPDSHAVVEQYRRLLGATPRAVIRLEGRKGSLAWQGVRSPTGYSYAASNGNFKVGWGDDGNSVWRQSWDGFVGYGGPHRRRLQETIERIVSGAIAFDVSDYVGCSRHRWHTYSLRSFYPENGAPAVIAFNARTSEIAFARVEPEGANLWLHGVSYIRSAGGRTIGGWGVGVEQFHANRSLPPAPGARLDYSPPIQQTTPLRSPFSLPVNMSRKGAAIATTASVNGVSGRFLIDSGASDLVITTAFAKRSGVRPQENIVVASASGVGAQGTLSRVNRLTIGPIAINGEPVVIRPRAYGYDGLLGLPLFGLGAVAFRHGDSSIVVSPSPERASPTDLPLDTYYGVPEAEGTIGYDRAAFVLDTGAPIDFVAPRRTAVSERAKPVSTPCPIENAVPSLQRFRYAYPRIVLGNTTYLAPQPCVFDMAELLERDDLGIAGFNAFGSAAMTLDYRVRRYSNGDDTTVATSKPRL